LTGVATGVVSRLILILLGLLMVLAEGVFVSSDVELGLDIAVWRLLCLACASCFRFRSWTWRYRREPSIAKSVAIDTLLLPPSDGFNFQLRACLKVSWSNLLLPLEPTIRALVTLPCESVSTATSTLPSIPRRLANSGYLVLQSAQAARPLPEPLELGLGLLFSLLFSGCVLICGVVGTVGATATGDGCTCTLLEVVVFSVVTEAAVLLL